MKTLYLRCLVSIAVIAGSAFITGCGGGNVADTVTAQNAPSNLLAALAALSTTSSTEPANARKQASAVATVAQVVPRDAQVYAWFENKYATKHQQASTTIQANGFTYRYYAKTNNFIGIKTNGEIYTMESDGILVYFGLNASLTCQITPTVCTQYVVSKVTADPVVAVQPYMMYDQKVTVKVLNATTGQPASNQQVTWQGTANGYAVPAFGFLNTGATNSAGEMTVYWVAGDSLTPALTANVVNQNGDKFSNVFNATTLAPTLIDGNKTPNTAYYMSWTARNAAGFSSDLTPNTEPTGTYYAMQWLDGYTGLARGGSHFDRQVQFSLWNKGSVPSSIVNAGTSICQEFGHEGNGVMCSANYAWAVNKTYRFEVTTAQVVTGYTDYTVHVLDVAANTSRFIATLRQFGTTPIANLIFFSEDFKRDYVGCKNVPEKFVSIDNIRVQSAAKVWSTAVAERRYVYSSNPKTTCANSGYNKLSGLGMQIGIGGTNIRTTNTTGSWESLLQTSN